MNYSEDMQKALAGAETVAAMYYKDEITDDKLFYAIYHEFQHGLVGKILYSNSVSLFMLRRKLDDYYEIGDLSYGSLTESLKSRLFMSEETKETIKAAEAYAKLTNCEEIDLAHLVLALLDSKNKVLLEYIDEEDVLVDFIQKDLIEYIY